MRHAVRAELPTIVDIWVDAFSTDPFFRWIAPDDATWATFGPDWMTFIVERTFERGHTYLDEDSDVAVAWIPPDVAFINHDDADEARDLIARHVGEAKADDAFVTVMAARDHALGVPHWTLQFLGVRSSRHGRGLGAAAVAPMLQVCDDERRPCGLNSSNARNVSFYERLGFAVVAEIRTPDGIAAMRPMHRPAAG